jgi:hypothetical protein
VKLRIDATVQGMSTMRHRSRGFAIVFLLVLLAALAAVLWGPLQRGQALAILEREVGAGNSFAVWTEERGLRAKAFDWLDDQIPKNTRDQDRRNRIMEIMKGTADHAAIHIQMGRIGDPINSAALARFPSLRVIYFQEAGIGISLMTEEEWTHQVAGIRNLPQLEELRIEGANLGDSALSPLAGHPALTTLVFGSSRLTVQGFKALASLPRLRELSIYSPASRSASSDLTEEQWALVCRESKALPHLRSLTLRGRTLTDAAIAPLAGHPTLETLSVLKHSLTPACASTLKDMPHLKVVNLGPDSDDFPQETMDAIRASAPGVLVRH